MLVVNNKYRVRKLDETNLVIEQLKIVSSETKGTREEWVWEGYYSSVEGALNSIFKKQLFDSVEQELEIKDILKVMKEIEKNILNTAKQYKIKLGD